MRWREVPDAVHESFFVLPADEPLQRVFILEFRLLIKGFVLRRVVCLFSPVLLDFLVRDAEQPRAELSVLSQLSNVFHGVDKGFLDNIQTRLFIAKALINIGIQWELKALEQRVPRFRLAFPGRWDRKRVWATFHEHFHSRMRPQAKGSIK